MTGPEKEGEAMKNHLNKGKKKAKSAVMRLKDRALKSREKRSPAYVIFSLLWRIFDHVVFGKGAELAYYLLFSLLPLVMFGAALLGLMNLDANMFTDISQVIPKDVQNLISSYYEFIKQGQSEWLMYTGLGLSIYFSSAAIRSLMRSLDVAYAVKKPRNPIFGFILSLFFAVIFLATIVVSLFLMVGGGWIIDTIVTYFPQLADYQVVVQIMRFVIMILPLFGIFLLMYIFLPHRKIRPLQAIPGALFSVVAWIGVSMIFSYYVSHFGRYATLYGSLGILLVLMLWLFLTGVIFVLGGELNAILMERKEYLRQKKLLDDGELADSAEPDDPEG